MSWLSAAGVVIKGFFTSIWDAMRRRRQDKERQEAAHRQAENASLKHGIEASKKARKVDDKIDGSNDSFDDLISGM